MIKTPKKYRVRIVCGYGYKLKRVDNQYSKAYKIYFGKDTTDKYMKKESEYCSNVTEIEFKEPLVKTNMDQEYFKNSSISWICKK